MAPSSIPIQAILLKDLPLLPPPSYTANKTLPLTQSIMQAKAVPNTQYELYIVVSAEYHKHLILKYKPKEVVKTRFHDWRNILEKILRSAPLELSPPLSPPSPQHFFMAWALLCYAHNPSILAGQWKVVSVMFKRY